MKRRRPREQHFPPELACERGSDDAHAALEHALSQWPDVHETTEDLRKLRRHNHFADTMGDALKGHRR